jgi:hypothetical protein
MKLTLETSSHLTPPSSGESGTNSSSAAEQRQKPQPTKTVYAKGSVEWFAEQKKSG